MNDQPHIIPEFWWWIRQIELDHSAHEGDIIPDRYCKQFIKYLEKAVPYLIKYHLPKYNDIMHDRFAEEFELKLFSEPEDKRFMLFDFIKDLLHENLIKRQIELGKLEFGIYRKPYWIDGDDY